jgi:hypothetical protein
LRSASLQIGALIVKRLDALVDLGEILRQQRPRQLGVDRADRELRSALALDPQRGRIEPHREIPGDERVVAGRQIQRDDAGDARAIGIDGHGIDLRGRIEIGRMQRPGNQRTRQHQAGGHKIIRNPTHDIPPEKRRMARETNGAPGSTARRFSW